MPTLAWGKGLNFGQDKPNKDDLPPPNLQFDPSDLGGDEERLADNGYDRGRESYDRGGYGNEPVNRDPNLERAPYSRGSRPGSSSQPGADLANNSFNNNSLGNNSFGNGGSSNPSGFGQANNVNNSFSNSNNGLGNSGLNNNQYANNRSSNSFGGNNSFGNSSLPNPNLLPTTNDPASHRSPVNGIPGGALPGSNGMASNGSGSTLPPMPGFGTTDNNFNNSNSGQSTNPLQPMNSTGMGGSSVANSLPAPPDMSQGFVNNGSLPSTHNSGGFANQPVNAMGNQQNMVQQAAPTMSDTSNMLKPFRPGSTANPTSSASSKSALPSYPSTRYGEYRSPVRTAQKPSTSGFGTTGLPSTNFQSGNGMNQQQRSSQITKHPNGVICDGDKCYLPQK